MSLLAVKLRTAPFVTSQRIDFPILACYLLHGAAMHTIYGHIRARHLTWIRLASIGAPKLISSSPDVP
jgi:hypothetical protein